MEVDFKKLTEANILCDKYNKKFKIKRNKFFEFMHDLKNNPSAFASKMTEAEARQFKKDLKVMFYNYEVENYLLGKYYPAIFHILRKLKVTHCDVIDDCVSLGLQAIRVAIFKYAVVERSFTSFVFQGIYSFLRGFLFRHKQEIEKNNEIFTAMYANEIADVKLHNQYDNEDLTWENIIAGANLTNEEIVLVKLFVDKKEDEDKWYTHFQRDYRTKKGGLISRTGVYDRLLIARKKIADYIILQRGEIYARQFYKIA